MSFPIRRKIHHPSPAGLIVFVLAVIVVALGIAAVEAWVLMLLLGAFGFSFWSYWMCFGVMALLSIVLSPTSRA